MGTSLVPGVPPSPNELNSYVFNGVWKRYDEPYFSSLKWTLGNFSALLVMACVTALIALAQAQCWSLVRYIITHHKKSTRLESSGPDPLLKLSQSEAIAAAMPTIARGLLNISERLPRRLRVRLCSGSNTQSQEEPVESPIFGLASLAIITLFIIMGFTIPWGLTEGALGTPIVKSRLTGDCLDSTSSGHLLDILNRATRADEIFSLCRDEVTGGCDTPYPLVDPVITKTRPTTCPFGGEICLPDVPSFEITHWNISPLVMGVNSRSQVSMNQRLTCAPITIDPFLWKYEDGSVIYVPKLSSDPIQLSNNISLILTTLNGPNKFSNESSGLTMFTEKGPFDLTVLPGYTAGTNYYNLPEPLILNEFLQRNDSQSFLVVLRAGLSQYTLPMDDPFFSAHNKKNVYPDDTNTSMYIADYEATALGCIEQFQYCFPPSPLPVPCTNWGARGSEFSAMLEYLSYQYSGQYNGDIHSLLEHSTDQNLLSVNEMFSLFRLVPMNFAIYDFLAIRIKYYEMNLLKRPKRVVEYNRWPDDYKEQWIIEVETWFMKALLGGILAIQDGALYTLRDLDPGFSEAYLREWKLCGRILFHSPDFTNINWLGLWTTIIASTVIVLVGALVDMFPERLEDWLNLIRTAPTWGDDSSRIEEYSEADNPI
ncbi:hypothetical protein L207DRAFT_610168 [Hyaloscypha variabilis F]|uniref:Uncharacterized protein n=1 Tax=Hyaloscypha variabilis (strain UAMH 11265 / GT02V1 / F) TaxID=1149755 RepID=A0A2J6R0W3_HYAVF|nr:hypothetical protein L207DRAFT_610168 [Hyaloscypha variabilis F]